MNHLLLLSLLTMPIACNDKNSSDTNSGVGTITDADDSADETTDLPNDDGTGIEDDSDSASDHTGEDTSPATDSEVDNDNDDDGYNEDEDCDDNDPEINPGVDEIPYDGVDNDCDPTTPDDDLDRDGFADGEDCDDADASINPDADEICDDVDNNCDGVIDEGSAVDAATWYLDADADGYGLDDITLTACEQPGDYSEYSGDCDDADAAYNPGALEDDCTDPNDYNCDGSVGFADDDGDGWAACEECDDSDSEINPDAEEYCDLVDNNCDGVIDEDSAVDASTWYRDFDSDDWGDPDDAVVACSEPIGFVDNGLDCDDEDDTLNQDDFDGDSYTSCNEDCDDDDASINPDANEICNELDDDCDDSIDEDAIDALRWYADTDEDGYGDITDAVISCEMPDGYTADRSDCDDTDASLNQDDRDGDGFSTCDDDCNDSPLGGAVSNPDADEICDDLDNDCDSDIDEGATDAHTVYADTDEDGDGDAGNTLEACEAPDGYVENSDDCDDTDDSLNTHDDDSDGVSTCEDDCDDATDTTFPGADETCNEVDDDCDLTVDEDADDATFWYADADEDGYGDPEVVEESCESPDGYTTNSSDCDDSAQEVSPDATEVCDGIDNNCNTVIDEDSAADASTWYLDGDEDGYGLTDSSVPACDQPEGYSANSGDCDDADTAYNPGAAEDDCADPNDYNCDGSVTFADEDEDGWAACEECDDFSVDVNPDATEICDDIDNNCDGTVDEPTAVDAPTWYADVDVDGYGDVDNTTVACERPSGYLSDSTDCDDGESTTFPGAVEVCDEVDQDCDITVDEDASDASTWYADADSDDFGDPNVSQESCVQPDGYTADATDCDDGVTAINPDATEVCDDVDNNCDTVIDEDSAADAGTWYYDGDADEFGNPDVSDVACDAPSGYIADGSDCDDDDADTYPGADETCDEEDDDCDEIIDEASVDAVSLAIDADADGLGAIGTTELRCEGVDNEWDCNDSDSTEPQVVDALSAVTPVGSLDAPWLTIQDGIDSAVECVVVLPATYLEDINFSGNSIDVWGVDGPETTIISGSGDAPVATFTTSETPAANLHGFTLSGGGGFGETSETSSACGSGETCVDYVTTYCGGGLYVEGATPTLSDLIVTDNDLTVDADYTSGNDSFYFLSYGGGLCLRDATASLTGVDFSSNLADEGGAIFLNDTSSATLSQSSIIDNGAENGGAAQIDGGTLSMSNVEFAWNTAVTEGGALLGIDAAVTAVNVTMGHNDAPSGGNLYASGASTMLVDSTIIYGAATGQGVLVDGTASFTGTYNNVYGNVGGDYSGVTDPTGTSGNISADPLFTAVSDDGDATNDDWSLGAGSPSIDAGDPSSGANDADGSRNDQGARGGPDGNW